MKYVFIQAGRVVEVVPDVARERPAAPAPLEDGAVSTPERDEQQRAHDEFVPGMVPLAERFHADHLASFETVVETPDDVDVTLGQLYTGKAFVDPPPPVPTVDEVRAERERRLNMSDWTQLRDVPEETASKWAKYRQALRDVPAQAGFPEKVKWPKEPTT